MECIDLRTGYMLLAFRSQKEVERAKALCESRGIRVACALSNDGLSESEAAPYVKKVEQEGKTFYCNYSNHCTDALCRTAKSSMQTALNYVNAITGLDCSYLLIYEKEEPLLQVHTPEQAQPAEPIA